MAIVFGTRLAGPGRSSRYHPGTSSAWKTVNGVPIPPRPEEPDNCCMSGCVHCVWDDYRDEMEEWAAVLAQAKAKGEQLKQPNVIPGAIPKTPDGIDSTSMDDDGGGSENNWSVGSGDDLFADIPVGIREFMKTEKKLKEMHRQEGSTDIILNKANIALARSQRLVASWLPSELETDSTDNAKTNAEIQMEEDEIFTAVPETLGLGAPLPSKAADGSWNRAELDSNDALRRQLLGRNYKKVMAEKERTRKDKIAEAGIGSGAAAKNNLKGGGAGGQQRSNGSSALEEDEDEGRAASIGKKASSRKRKIQGSGGTTPFGQTEGTEGELKNEAGEGGDESKTATSQQRPKAKGRKKATSFLDEILAERSKKRTKR
ncbi:hypothetical protein BDV06DRAFT_232619 [Aspergillus oleicola]